MGTYIKGQNLRVMAGGKCIAAATSCVFHITAQVENSSTKDSVSGWAENEVVGLSWDAQTDALVVLSDSAQGKTAPDLIGMMVAASAVTLVFDQTNGDQNRTGTNSAIKKSGSAYITDISVTAQNRANGTCTVQFTGTGALS